MEIFEFGEFRICSKERKLLKKTGEVVPLTPRVFDLLLTLVKNSDRVLTKDELLTTVWVDCIVEEANLSQSIFVLRKALGETAHRPQFIRTIPHRGYRFISPVKSGSEIGSPRKGIKSGWIPKLRSGFQFFPLPPKLRSRTAIVAVTLLGLILFAIAGTNYFQKASETSSSIAVLPFTNATGDANNDYLTDGLTEGVTNNLARLPSLRVLARSVVAKYKGREISPISAGSEFGTDTVLIGTLARRDDLFSLHLELVKVSTGTLLWGGNYTRSVSEMVGLQEEIARRTTESLHITLTPQDQNRLSKKYTENSEAYSLYLRGLAFWRKGYTLDNYQKAIDYYNQALALDPNYALAYAGIADCHNMIAENKIIVPSDELSKARDASLRALAIDENLPEAHLALAWTELSFEWDWCGAEREFQKAIELNPNLAQAHFWYSLLLRSVGRLDQALAEIKQAQDLDPIYLDNGMGTMLYHLRRYDEAIGHYSKKLELEPENINAHAWLFQLYAVRGMKKDSVRELETTFKQIEKSSPDSLEGSMASIKFERGYDTAMSQMIKIYLEKSQKQYVAAYDIARAYALTKDRENTLTWLEKAFEERATTLPFIAIEPLWDDVRQEPRFKGLVRRMNLENKMIAGSSETICGSL